MNQHTLWNLEAIFNTLLLYHRVCECPTYEECVKAGDSWMCEHCLAMEGKLELGKLLGNRYQNDQNT